MKNKKEYALLSGRLSEKTIKKHFPNWDQNFLQIELPPNDLSQKAWENWHYKVYFEQNGKMIETGKSLVVTGTRGGKIIYKVVQP